ncbi:MAG TPA: type I restriction enzyme HsdR N-terminal domain-containing protein [Longimicrobium sp.]|nr:type I restriction enzyme HsdR N-terminal domain-containing protein [Longimicrobium sp.]
MKAKPLTEADLEARISAALGVAFPWLAPEDFGFQTRFTFQVGRQTVCVDGKTASRVEARSDVLVSHRGEPLAVLELKRPGQPITVADEKQGLSYAALLNPHPPLVVVTNGEETRLLDSYTGQEWKPEHPSEKALTDLVRNAGEIAAARLKDAIAVLLGSGSAVWAPAVRAATEGAIRERSGAWDELLRPFVPDFLIPRAATDTVLAGLKGSRRLIVVEGVPLIGKSSVLRDLAARTAEGDEFAVLLLEAGHGGVLRALADVLSDALAWPLTPDEARHWLRQLSHRAGDGRAPTLVLAVDGVGLDHQETRGEVDQLTAGSYGLGLRIVLAADESVADRLMMDGRSETRIARRAVRVPVLALDDAEFEAAAKLLWDHRFGIARGGQHSGELRIPWVLRSLGARLVAEPEYANEALAGMLPPLIGVELVDIARERLQRHPELRLALREVGRAVLAESEDEKRPVSLILASVATFVVRRDTLVRTVAARDLDALVSGGVLKLTFGPLDQPLYVVRVPELLAAIMATLLAERLQQAAEEDPADAADWLERRAGGLPLGDVIAAQAILDLATMAGSVPFGVVSRLLSRAPRTEPFRPGMTYAIPTGEFEAAEFSVETEGPGSPIYGDFQPWLILSHLAGLPLLAMQSAGAARAVAPVGRVDPALLMQVASCPIPLRAPARAQPLMTLTHDLLGGVSVVCHLQGIVEPITLSLMRFLGTSGSEADEWIAEAAATGSLPLLMRLMIALGELSHGTTRPQWAAEKLATVRPALDASGLLH